jgi:hypothetical protein
VASRCGFAKKIHQRMPQKLKCDFSDFTKTVRDCLLKVTLERSRRFQRHYAKISEEAEADLTEAASAQFDQIEALVNCCFKAVNVEGNQKKKWKNTVDTKPKKTELKQIVSVEEAYT